VPKVLRGLHIDEVSTVDAGDNPPAWIRLYKRARKGLEGFGPDDYAHAPDPRTPSTWRARLADRPGAAPTKRRVAQAYVELQTGDLTADALPAAKRRAVAAWLKVGDPAPFAKALVGREPAELDAESLEEAWQALGEAIAPGLPATLRKWLEPMLDRLGFRKEEHEPDPRSFDDVREDWSAYHAKEVIDGRLDALRSAVCEILMSESEDKEGLVRQSVEQFATEMEAQVGEILAGRIAKGLGSRAKTDDTPPRGGRSHAMPQPKIDLAKLPEPLRKGLEKVAWDKVPQEAVDALTELGTSNTTFAGQVATLTGQVAALEKKLQDATLPAKPDPDDADPIMKGLTPEARAAVKADRERQAAETKKRDERIAALEADARTARLQKSAEPYKLFGKTAVEIAAIFAKAETAGVLADVMGLLTVANEAAAKGKILEELGSDAAILETTAFGKMKVMAAELRKVETKMTEAQAFAKVMRENPELARQHRAEQHAAARTVN